MGASRQHDNPLRFRSQLGEFSLFSLSEPWHACLDIANAISRLFLWLCKTLSATVESIVFFGGFLVIFLCYPSLVYLGSGYLLHSAHSAHFAFSSRPVIILRPGTSTLPLQSGDGPSFYAGMNRGTKRDRTPDKDDDGGGGAAGPGGGGGGGSGPGGGGGNGGKGGAGKGGGPGKDGNPSPNNKRPKLSPNAKSDRLWACHYYQHDPAAHIECRGKIMRRIVDVRQHIDRFHKQPVHCPKCGQKFEGNGRNDQLQRHVASQSCQKADFTYTGATKTQWDDIRDRGLATGPGTPDERRWYKIWEILFGLDGEIPRPSPYYYGSEVSERVRIASQSLFDDQSFQRLMDASEVPPQQHGTLLGFFNLYIEALISRIEGQAVSLNAAADASLAPQPGANHAARPQLLEAQVGRLEGHDAAPPEDQNEARPELDPPPWFVEYNDFVDLEGGGAPEFDH